MLFVAVVAMPARRDSLFEFFDFEAGFALSLLLFGNLLRPGET